MLLTHSLTEVLNNLMAIYAVDRIYDAALVVVVIWDKFPLAELAWVKRHGGRTIQVDPIEYALPVPIGRWRTSFMHVHNASSLTLPTAGAATPSVIRGCLTCQPCEILNVPFFHSAARFASTPHFRSSEFTC